MSPLVEALLRLYPPGTITLQAGTLEEDVAVVLGARHLVASQGTFAYALALASPNLETLYMFNNIVHALDERAFWCDVNKVYSYAPNAGEYIGRRSAAQLSTTALMREKRLQRLETFGSASGGASTTSVGNALPAPERIMVTNGTPAIVYKF
ncbi:hypothetical protein KSW81_002013 [Nannochloris sp. 'desiccata']|nr:hypothetical protein KSW81_002013 [Chlorella desiccata (nom. nud.)]